MPEVNFDQVKKDAEDKVRRLNTVRSVIEKMNAEKSKMQGNIEADERNLSEIRETVKKDFGCDDGDLADLCVQLNGECERLTNNAEVQVGIKQGTIIEAKSADPAPDQRPAPKTAIKQARSVDPDSL
jgi:hypothetical protein